MAQIANITKSPKQIIFACQDPGSANALIPVIKTLLSDPNFAIQVFAKKYSCQFLKKAGIDFVNMNDIEFNPSLLSKTPDIIILGASSGFSIEKELTIYAKEKGIKTISILDFWSNYALRYSKDPLKKDLSYLPDFIFVMDNIAKKRMIEEKFPANRIIITGNPFFDTFFDHQKHAGPKFQIQNISRIRQINQFNQINNLNQTNILYISQPVVKNRNYYADLKTVTEILSVISQLNKKLKLTIKCHPKEDPNIYQSIFSKQEISIEIITSQNVKELLSEHKIIIGKNSMVLFESVCLGKTVISYQPVKSKYDSLISNDLNLSFRANNIDELKNLLKQAIENTLPNTNANLLSNYLDKNNTKRAINEISKILKNSEEYKHI